MKKTINIFLIILLCVILISCDKETEVTIPTDVVTEDNGYNENEGIDKAKIVGNLVADGKSAYTIIYPNDFEPGEETAALELQSYIEKVTGVKIPAVTDRNFTGKETGKYISIGDTIFFEKSNLSTENLNLDGFILKTVGEMLYIKGQRTRGTLYGVYDFLEKIVGVKFLTISYEYIPSSTKIELPELDVVEIPTFRMRGDYYEAVKQDLFYGAKMRYTTPTQSANADAIGGGFKDDWFSDFHSFHIIVPFNEYYAKHPEWYTNSQAAIAQPCLASGLNDDGSVNYEMGESYLKATIDEIKEAILERPDVVYYHIGQEDNTYVCTCADCLRQVKKFGTRSGQMIAFVNAAATAIYDWIKEENIDLGHEIYFSTFAYSYSVMAPTYRDEAGNYIPYDPAVVPAENVYVMFAPIGACYSHALNDPDCTMNMNDTYIQFAGWASICSNFYIFDYNVNFNDFLAWHPSMGVMKDNLLYYEDIGVSGIITEGAASECYNYYQQDLMSWMYSKLLWNPHRDVNALISEFNRYYFASEEIGKILDEYVAYMNGYYEMVSHTQSTSLLHATTFSNSSRWLVSAQTLNKQFLEGAEKYILEIEKIVESNPNLTEKELSDFRHNIISLNIQIEYMKYINYDSVFYTTEEEKTMFLTKLFDDAEFLNVQAFKELGPRLADLRAQAGV